MTESKAREAFAREAFMRSLEDCHQWEFESFCAGFQAASEDKLIAAAPKLLEALEALEATQILLWVALHDAKKAGDSVASQHYDRQFKLNAEILKEATE